jgi:cytochrome c2
LGFPVLKALLVAAAILSNLPAVSAERRPPRAPSPSASPRVRCLGCHPAPHGKRGGCVGCHRGNPGTDRRDLAHAGFLPAEYVRFTLPGEPIVEAGRRLLDRSGCRRCHVSGGEGNRLAADLDAAFPARPARLREALLAPAVHMPDFRFDEPSVRALLNAVYANGASRVAFRPGGRAAPLKVHFDAGARGSRPGKHPFDALCGGCHRAIAGDGSGRGTGASGPNLSGLFTRHYPGRAPDGASWDPGRLARWAANPRALRPGALMPPVAATPRDIREAAAALSLPSGMSSPGEGGGIK